MRRFIEWFQFKFLGYRFCPACKAWIRWKWIKHVIVFEDEPPMFGEWECKSCKWKSGIKPTIITENAVKKLGYKDFLDFSEREILSKKGDKNVTS